MGRDRPIVAVTFDFWQTLVRTSGDDTRMARAASVTAALGRYAHEVDPQALELAFDHAFMLFNDAWHENRQVTAVDAAHLVVDHLGFDLAPGARVAVVESFVHGAAGLDMQLADHLEETLVGLKEREVRLAIICDVGLTPSASLRGYLDAHGVLDLFDHWSFSDEVGCYKPARQIFEHALTGLGGVTPARAAHVGDLRRTDVAGAQAMGMTAVRYCGINDDPAAPDLPEGDHVIGDHIELFAALGLD